MSALILVVQLLLAIALIGIVLIQRTSQSGLGLGDSDGGGLSGLLSGRGTANFLTRTTALLGTGFLAACILSAVLATQSGRTGSGLENLTRDNAATGESSAPALLPAGASSGEPAVPAADSTGGLAPAGASPSVSADPVTPASGSEPAVPAN